MNRRLLWAFSILAGTAAACGAPAPANPLESPLGEIQGAGTPRTVVRVTGDTTPAWIRDIAVSANDLYVSVPWHGVYRMPKYGGAITPVDEGSNVAFIELATGSDAVFWEHTTFDKKDFPHARVKRQDFDGGPIATLYEANLGFFDSSETRNLQTDGGIVYVTLVQNITDDGAIHRLPAAGGEPLANILPFNIEAEHEHSQSLQPIWVAVAGAAYFTQCADGPACEIWRAAGDEMQDLGPAPPGVSRVTAVDRGEIFLDVQTTEAAVWKVDLASGAATRLVSPAAGADRLVVDANEVFFVSGADSIRAVPRAGGDDRVVADLTGQGTISRLIADDTHIFALVDQSEVVMIPKQPLQ
jgi:hypothetical protein